MNRSEQKKVLFLIFGFPPRAGSGIQRAVRFVQHLPKNGWEPIILTIPKWGNDIIDTRWEKQLPENLKIYRVFSLDPFRIFQALRKSPASGNSAPENNSHGSVNNTGFLQLVRNLFHKISIPDHAVWWVPTALVFGLYLVIRHRPHLIFSTSGPYGTAVAGLLLAKLTGLKWVAEFRDPWAANQLRKRSGTAANFETSLEKSCLQNASAVITTTKQTAFEYKSRTPGNGCSNFVTISNGFHPPDFQANTEPENTGRLNAVYTGMFYGSHTPDYFFEGIRKACSLSEDFKQEFKLIIAGSMPPESRQKAKEPPLDAIVEIIPYVPHDEVIRMLNSADLLYLALESRQGDIIPGKLFEYLAARRFIFATVPDGITADIIRRFKAGVISRPNNADDIAENLLEVFRLHRQGRLRTSHSLDDVKEYSWAELTGCLGQLFDEIFERKIP